MNLPNILQQFSNHIIFQTLHYTFIAMQLREELAKTSTTAARSWQPFVLWLNHVMLTYAGDILVNLLLGKLPLEPLGNVQEMLMCTASWYLIFYSPCDCAFVVARCVAFRMLSAPITAISQVVHIDKAIQLAGRMYGHNALVPILIIGTVVGSGAEFLKPIAALLINRCQLSNAAYVKLSTIVLHLRPVLAPIASKSTTWTQSTASSYLCSDNTHLFQVSGNGCSLGSSHLEFGATFVLCSIWWPLCRFGQVFQTSNVQKERVVFKI
ncbi:trimeric intracellular cation channel type 1B.1 isoform X2 [Drosophila innubila]|uniref:trimeric intracellular cation channel type 1B.1 isoform X2 n=1 Tax=Drosophila innubila TaxID=198719 RepID=UPI00148C97EA|nr:trimeric intracellular cation channel type 1B.1 isoform X2 [Drosophila innubila]